MPRSDKNLCLAYAAIAIIALFVTWSFNLAFMAQPDNGMMAGFFRQAYSTPAGASFSNDLLMLTIAAGIFMVVEARRLRIRFVWIYIVLSALVAISVMFPLFLIARQSKLAQARAQRTAEDAVALVLPA